MISESPLQFAYWNLKRFLAIILSIQVGLWIVIALETLGLTIPLVRPILGTLYVVFIPGSIVLRLLKLRKLSDIEVTTYSVGLSIVIVMALGLLVNTVFVALNIPGPMSVVPLLTVSGILVSGLCLICYVRNDATIKPQLIDSNDLLTPTFLSVSLLLPLTIFGAFLLNQYRVPAVNIAIIVLIAALILIIGLKKPVHERLYPYVLFVVALTLLLRNSLVTSYIWGTDINVEYYLANLVISGGFWDPHASFPLTWANNYNSMLSVVILPPVLSQLTGLSLIWVYKIIYPLIYSLVPLVLYVTVKKQIGAKIAFAAGLLFVISFSFYIDMLALPRQQIAELFLSLLILAMVSSQLVSSKRSLLLFVFGAGLVVSHYSTAYLFAFLIIFGLLLFSLKSRKQYFDTIKRQIPLKANSVRTRRDTQSESSQNRSAISLTFALFIVAFAFAWFTFVNGSPFASLVDTTVQITSSITSDYFSGSSNQVLGIVTGTLTPMQMVTRDLFYVLSFFAILGLVSVRFKQKELPIQKTYFALAIGATVVLIACTTLPFFASALQASRFYHFAELFLTPFIIIGMVSMFSIPFRKLKRGQNASKAALQITSFFLALFLLFNSGIMYTLAHEPVSNAAVIASEPNVQYFSWTNSEVESAKWLHNYHGEFPFFGSKYFPTLLEGLDLRLTAQAFLGNTLLPPGKSYTIIGSPVYQYDELMVKDVEKNRSKIYSSGDTGIYF